MNKVFLIGNLTRDVELAYTKKENTAVAKFAIAVNEYSKEKEKPAMFIDVVAFGKGAENANQYLSKGKRVVVHGKLNFERWEDKEGNKHSKHSVIAESMNFIDYSQGDDNE